MGNICFNQSFGVLPGERGSKNIMRDLGKGIEVLRGDPDLSGGWARQSLQNVYAEWAEGK